MTSTTVDDPDIVETKNVDGNGRIYVGQDYAYDSVEVVLKVKNKGETQT